MHLAHHPVGATPPATRPCAPNGVCSILNALTRSPRPLIWPRCNADFGTNQNFSSLVSSIISVHLPLNSVKFGIWGKDGKGAHNSLLNALSSTDGSNASRAASPKRSGEGNSTWDSACSRRNSLTFAIRDPKGLSR